MLVMTALISICYCSKERKIRCKYIILIGDKCIIKERIALAEFPDTLITWYLEMTDPKDALPQKNRLDIRPMFRPDIPFYLFLYKEVGGRWQWRDRLLISEPELLAAIGSPWVSIQVLYVEGVPAGYIELAQGEGGDTEIVYFGLREGFTGFGYGQGLLLAGIYYGWGMAGTKRLWVHTCNLDSSAALPLYQKCGFRFYDEQREPMPPRYGL
jgi:GNAT superfamily N-acetyltransferase